MAKGKAETKKKKDEAGFPWHKRAEEQGGFHEYGFARFLHFMAETLDWEKRGICEHAPEAQIVMHSVDMEVRLQDLEKKHQDLIDNLRIFMGKEEV